MNDRNSSAHRFFDRMKESPDRLAFMRDLVNSASPTFEGEWLDFKGAAKCDDKFLKEIWSKSLSAFANTEGGIIVWGIDARKDPDTGIDAAHEFSLSSNPAALKSRLLELHHEATDPPVSGVEIEYISDPSEEDAGFVICLIPESGFKPHRTKCVKNKPYYIRAGDNFVVPSPALLRQLFFPHTHSHLWVEVVSDWNAPSTMGEAENSDEKATIDFKVRLHNSGTATARDVYIVIQSNLRFTSTFTHEDWNNRRNPQGVLALEAKRPLHPGTVSALLDFSSNVPVSMLHDSSGRKVLPLLEEQVKLRFLFYASDREPQAAEVCFSQDEIVHKAAKKGKKQIADWHRMIPSE